MNITVVGSGYVGLVTGAVFSKVGNKVICLDINETIVKNLNDGVIPIYEPGLEDIIKESKKKNYISFTTDKKKAYEHGEIIFICVPTPQKENGEVNLNYVYTAAKEIGENINSYKIVVDKSTVPVGTGDEVEKIINEELKKRKSNHIVDVVSNPEFLAEGSAVQDFLYLSRICVGGETNKAKDKMKELYHPFTINGAPIFLMDRKSAELSKYACNSMLATRVSFMNQFANLAESVGADIESVRKVMQTDPRIGSKFLYPGIGYGGSCFPKDVKGIINTAKKYNKELTILEEVDKANHKQKLVLVNKVKDYYKNKLKEKQIAVWGLAFKKNTNDMRESPSIPIIQELVKEGAIISAYDPIAKKEAEHYFKDTIKYVNTKEQALEGKEILLILADWDEFKQLDYKVLKEKQIRAVFDGKNFLEPIEIKKHKIEYFGIGRK